MRSLLSLVGASLVASASSLAGCGGSVDDGNCGIVACGPGEPPPAPKSTPRPDERPPEATLAPVPSQPGSTCVASLVDGFDTGTWSPAWGPRQGPASAPTRDELEIVPMGGRGSVLSVYGQGTTDGWTAAAAMTTHTTCMPARAHFAFDYRIDEGSLDDTRADHGEIAELTALNTTGVSCGVLMHVRQGRVTATTGQNIDLGDITAKTWTRLEMTFEGSTVSFTRDGQVVGSLPMGCVPQASSSVRFSVSGGRSINPGAYRAFFDDVRFEAAQ